MNTSPKIVLTGGPCGGKSKAAKLLKTEIEKLGYNVILIEEAAHKLITDGVDRTSLYRFQKQIALHQLELEHKAEQQCKNNTSSVIICDRGLMDCKVYLDDNDFAKIKKELNLTNVQMRDRYDAVFHLDSTAGSDFYKKGIVRIESSQEANMLNKKSLYAWCGNPHYRFVSASASFDEKFNVLLSKVKHFLGIPKPLEIERKFLIKYPDVNALLNLPCVKVEISQTYLCDGENKFRLRKRGENGSYIYIRTHKRKINDLTYEEIEQQISEEEYNSQLEIYNILGTISKERYCLMYNGTYFEIDIFPFWSKQAYLEVELESEDENFTIPNCIEIIEEVTYNQEYKNSSLCKKIPKEK